MAIPYVTIHNIEKTKLSDELGFQSTNLVFSFDTDCYFYTVRCNGTSSTTGIEIDSKDLTIARFRQETVASLRNFTVKDMRIMLANTQFTSEIFYTDLYQEGENRINIYGLSTTWEFTPYDNPIERPSESFVMNFVGKLKNNYASNPHYAGGVGLQGMDLPSPDVAMTQGFEQSQANYNKFTIEENNSTDTTTFSVMSDTVKINWFFKFDIITALEQKQGAGIWGTATTNAEKMTIVRDKIKTLKLHHHGHGEADINGANAGIYFALWNGTNYITPNFIANGIDDKVFSTKEWDFTVEEIGDDGFIYCLLYTNSGSTPLLSVDYIEVQVEAYTN